jgi:CDP-glycerol glycerophosphotransferase (TagB/SpsB family)
MREKLKIAGSLCWKLFFLTMVLVASAVCMALKRWKHSNVWIIGENRGDSLYDNGYFFYRFCRRFHQDEKIYFLIKRDSPIFLELSGQDNNVVPYGSLRHALLFSCADVCFYTHTYTDVMYRRIFEIMRGKKKLVFLHHGVLGFKKFNDFYQEMRNVMDIFVVGNRLEWEILATQVGISSNKLQLTGYPRYDYLENRVMDFPKQIVYIPTYRDWVTDSFCDSEFYREVSAFLNNGKLNEILTKHDAVLNVYFHKYMQSLVNENDFKGERVKLLKLGESSPSMLISTNSLMITDYSSVSWDFFYLGKPVLFYRFDMAEYLKSRDSYIPLDKECIGEIVFNQDELLKRIEEYCDTGFVMKPRFENYRQSVLPALDGRNCARVYDAVKLLQEDHV